jgi:hypothetical protein
VEKVEDIRQSKKMWRSELAVIFYKYFFVSEIFILPFNWHDVSTSTESFIIRLLVKQNKNISHVPSGGQVTFKK